MLAKDAGGGNGALPGVPNPTPTPDGLLISVFGPGWSEFYKEKNS